LRIKKVAVQIIALTVATALLSGCGLLNLSFGVKYPKTTAEIEKPADPWLGAFLDDGLTGVSRFEGLTNTKLNSLLIFRSFGKNPAFNPGEAKALKKAGIVPMIGWEPFDPLNKKNLKGYSLQHIVDGDFDTLIENWADALRAFDAPIMMRFAHEMNGAWYPWGVDLNGNTPALYIEAWRHVHDIFTSRGADNVAWVWSPNIVRENSKYELKVFYPGDDYVDIMGLVGYGISDKDTYDSVFGPSIAQLKAISTKKILITETAGSALLKNREAWIKSFFDGLSKDPQIMGYYWFQKNKRKPWVIKTPADAASYSTAVAKYKKDWSALVGGKQ